MARDVRGKAWEFFNSRVFTSVLFSVLLSIGGTIVKGRADAESASRERLKTVAEANAEVQGRAQMLWRAAATVGPDAPLTWQTLNDVLMGKTYRLLRFRGETLEGVVSILMLNTPGPNPRAYRALGACQQLPDWISYPRTNEQLAGNVEDILAVTWLGFRPWLTTLNEAEREAGQRREKSWPSTNETRQKIHAWILNYTPGVFQ